MNQAHSRALRKWTGSGPDILERQSLDLSAFTLPKWL